MDITDRIFLDSVLFKGEIYRVGASILPHCRGAQLTRYRTTVGDWIHVFNPEYPSRPIIGQIFKAWKKPE